MRCYLCTYLYAVSYAVAAALFAGVLACVPGPLAADVLVLRDGKHIATEGAWEVRGRQVIYRSREGVLSAVRGSEVDLPASEAATKAEKAPPAPPPAPPRNEDSERVRLVDIAKANEAKGPPAAVIDPDAPKTQPGGFAVDTTGLDSPTEQRLYRLGIRIGQKLVAIDREFDLSTPQGAQAAAQDLRSLAREVRMAAEGEEGKVRTDLEAIASRLEKLADLARDDPEQFLTTIRAYG